MRPGGGQLTDREERGDRMDRYDKMDTSLFGDDFVPEEDKL